MNPDVTEGGRMINRGSRWAVVAGLTGAAMLAGAVGPQEAGAWTAPVALQARQGATPGAQDAPVRIIFRGATVIDGTGASARAAMAIVVDGERIEAIVPVAELTDELLEGQEGRRSGFVEVDLGDPAVDSVFAAMSRNGTVLDATLRIFVEMERRQAAADSAAAANEAADSAGAGPTPPDGPPIDLRRRGVRPRCGASEAVALTRRAYEAGVMIAAGTDGMTPPDSVFPALHDEIRLLHDDVGMPMMDVIRAATFHGAVALGLEDEIGTIEPGKFANIVFLREDPLAGPKGTARFLSRHSSHDEGS